RAAAKESRSSTGHALRHQESRLAAFNGARSGDDRQLRPADAHLSVGEVDNGVVFLNIAADQLVGLADANDFADARHVFQRAGLDLSLISGDSDGRPLRSGYRVRAVPHGFNLLAY